MTEAPKKKEYMTLQDLLDLQKVNDAVALIFGWSRTEEGKWVPPLFDGHKGALMPANRQPPNFCEDHRANYYVSSPHMLHRYLNRYQRTYLGTALSMLFPPVIADGFIATVHPYFTCICILFATNTANPDDFTKLVSSDCTWWDRMREVVERIEKRALSPSLSAESAALEAIQEMQQLLQEAEDEDSRQLHIHMGVGEDDGKAILLQGNFLFLEARNFSGMIARLSERWRDRQIEINKKNG